MNKLNLLYPRIQSNELKAAEIEQRHQTLVPKLENFNGLTDKAFHIGIERVYKSLGNVAKVKVTDHTFLHSKSSFCALSHSPSVLSTTRFPRHMTWGWCWAQTLKGEITQSFQCKIPDIHFNPDMDPNPSSFAITTLFSDWPSDVIIVDSTLFDSSKTQLHIIMRSSHKSSYTLEYRVSSSTSVSRLLFDLLSRYSSVMKPRPKVRRPPSAHQRYSRAFRSLSRASRNDYPNLKIFILYPAGAKKLSDFNSYTLEQWCRA